MPSSYRLSAVLYMWLLDAYLWGRLGSSKVSSLSSIYFSFVLDGLLYPLAFNEVLPLSSLSLTWWLDPATTEILPAPWLDVINFPALTCVLLENIPGITRLSFAIVFYIFYRRLYSLIKDAPSTNDLFLRCLLILAALIGSSLTFLLAADISMEESKFWDRSIYSLMFVKFLD